MTEQYCTVIPAPVKSLEQWIDHHIHKRHGDPNAKCVKAHKFVPCRFGTPDIPEPFKPSYHGIETINKINDPDSDLIHVVEIRGFDVYFNGALITESYERFDSLRHYKPPTKANLLKFCKAVIWSILPRDIVTFNGGKNGVVTTALDDAELRRYIALYPALDINQIHEETSEPAIIAAPELLAVPEILKTPVVLYAAMGEDLSLPEPDPVLSYEELTGYPAIEPVDHILVDIEEMVYDAKERHYDNLDQDYQHETTEEIINAFMPARVTGWISHLKLSIQEVPS